MSSRPRQLLGLSVRTGPGGLLPSAQVQQVYELIIAADPTSGQPEHTAQVLGLAATTGALAVALLAAEITGTASWDGVLPLSDTVAELAWDAFPLAVPEATVAAATAV